MTYNELYRSVSSLGFEGEIDDPTILTAALRRAHHELFLDRPEIKVARIMKPYCGETIIEDLIIHRPDVTDFYSLSGVAYSMRAYGKGVALILTGGAEIIREFDGNNVHICGFLKGGEGRIRFIGEFAFTVTSLACFSHIYSDREADIPFAGEASRIDLRRMFDDYFSSHAAPTDKNGKLIPGAYIDCGILTLPNDFVGEVLVTYMRSPVIYPDIHGDEVLDVPPDAAELLPLLVASYVWLDDEPERAQYYMRLYKEGIAQLRRYTPSTISSDYVTNGWA